MRYVHTKYLREGLADLDRRGGKFQQAAKTVYAILGRINEEDPSPFRGCGTTHHGENRLKHCVKYDLSGACRLVTVVDSGITFLLYVGIHTDVDQWLDRNRGKEFAVNEANQLVETLRPADIKEPNVIEPVPQREMSGSQILIERLEASMAAVLLDGLPFRTGTAVSNLTSISTDDEINNVCALIEDEVLADAMLDVLIALAGGKIREAEARILLYQGTYLQLEEAEKIEGGQDLQFVPTDSPQWAKLYEHFAKTAGYKDWMLFLHPDQEYVVKEDFNGPAKLLGVSGSGKTCVVVKRALRLASEYPQEKVLILTLNRSLSKLIADLVEAAVPESLQGQIEVKPFFEVCQELIYRYEPGSQRYYSDVTWKSEEHIDAIWREFYRCDLNNFDAAVMQPVHDSLIAQGVDAESYIREEFDWIRSAIAHKDREAYLEMDRKGRSFSLLRQQRKLLLDGLAAWERKMHSVGVIDGLGLVAALQPWLDQIAPMYRSILVDESQDFGTSELEIIRRLVEAGDNDLFICGDAAQQVSSKYQKLSEAGISIHGTRSRRILKNYRNSLEILTAAYSVLVSHINDFHFNSEDFEVLDPQFADFHGSTPLLLSAEDLESEIGHAISFLKEETANNRTLKACIALAGYSLYEVQAFGKRLNIPVLDGSRSIDEHAIYMSDLAQTKGFEFDIMVVVNAREGIIPNPGVPEMEQAKDLAQLYVAMTRARTQLVLSYHKQVSPLLRNLDDVFLSESWSTYNGMEVEVFGTPPRLSDLNEDTRIPSNLAEMDGTQFLYTEHALGLTPPLIEALRDKVGKSDPQSGRLTIAVDIGYAHQRTIEDPAARNRFGPATSKGLQELGIRLGLSAMHKARLTS